MTRGRPGLAAPLLHGSDSSTPFQAVEDSDRSHPRNVSLHIADGHLPEIFIRLPSGHGADADVIPEEKRDSCFSSLKGCIKDATEDVVFLGSSLSQMGLCIPGGHKGKVRGIKEFKILWHDVPEKQKSCAGGDRPFSAYDSEYLVEVDSEDDASQESHNEPQDSPAFALQLLSPRSKQSKLSRKMYQAVVCAFIKHRLESAEHGNLRVEVHCSF
jgi:hypothetical protein